MTKVSLLFSLCILLALFSCSSQKKDVSIQPTLDEAQQYFAQNDHQKAIESYSIALQKYPDDGIVLKGYIKILEEIKMSADKAFEAKKYDLAQSRYSTLLNNFPRFKTFEKTLSFDTRWLTLKIKECLLTGSLIQVQEAMRSGNYATAIGAQKKGLQTFPGWEILKENLIKTIAEIHSIGNKALEEEDYLTAGKSYSALFDNYAWMKKAVSTLPLTPLSLEDRIKRCRTQLTRMGLLQYRKGNLKEAISIWKGILKFDPQNQEIKKAIANAEEQLKKIKKTCHLNSFMLSWERLEFMVIYAQ